MRGADLVSTRRARHLRRAGTDAEAVLWRQLRARSLQGFKFVRQEPIGPYVVDFACREKRLIIEVDGGQHAGDPNDRIRDAWLAERQYRVLRFWNNDVLGNTAGVLERIVATLRDDGRRTT
jgi:very-short-patch-repair endonuclease